MGTRWPKTCWATYKEQFIRRNKYNTKWHLVGFLFHIELRCTVNHTSNLIFYLHLKMSSEPNLTILPSSVSKSGYLYKHEVFVKIIKRITSQVQVQVLPTCGVNPGGGQIFRTHLDRTWGPPNILYNRYRFCPWGKGARAWYWPPTPSGFEVKERVELYLCAPLGLCGLFWGELYVLSLPLPVQLHVLPVCGVTLSECLASEGAAIKSSRQL